MWICHISTSRGSPSLSIDLLLRKGAFFKNTCLTFLKFPQSQECLAGRSPIVDCKNVEERRENVAKTFMKVLQQGLEEFLGALFHTCVCFFLPGILAWAHIMFL